MLSWRGLYLGPNAALKDIAIRAALDPTFACMHRQPDHRPTPSQARSDAALACFLAHVAGLPRWSSLYLDLDEFRYSPEYIDAWVETVDASALTPSLRASHVSIVELSDLGLDFSSWAFFLVREPPGPPTWAGAAWARGTHRGDPPRH